MMFCVAAVHGISLAAQSNTSAEQASRSDEKSVGNSSLGEQKSSQSRGEQNEASANQYQTQKKAKSVTKNASKNLSTGFRTKRAPSHPGSSMDQVTNNLRSTLPANSADFRQPDSKAANVPARTANPHGTNVSASLVAVNGQQFKNSRDPGARLAVSGGSLTAARGTAGINGTTMKRKP
jgi:hypothetical protein